MIKIDIDGKVLLKEKPFIVEYSPRTIAVFGDTKPFVEQLKKLKGSFNPNLTYEGEKKAGWVFLKIYKKDIEEWLNKLSYEVKDLEDNKQEEKTKKVVKLIEEDEELSLGEMISKVKDKTETEEMKIENFCRNISQENFNKLQKQTREDFKRFALVLINIQKGDQEIAKRIIKLKG
jgi:BMFP domain-containing protein YqiC